MQNVIFSIGWHGPSIGKDNAATYGPTCSRSSCASQTRVFSGRSWTGLATAVDLGYYTQRNVGPINVIMQTTPTKPARRSPPSTTIAHFNDKNYFTDEHLESAKALLEADDLYSREKPSEYAYADVLWASTGIDYFRGYLPTLRRTSRADINRYVTNYIQGKPHIGLVRCLTKHNNKHN